MIVRTARDLGHTIRQRRRRQGWSQAQLAAAAGVSRQWVVAVEQGKPTAEVGAVLRTLAALGTVIDVIDAPPAHGDIDLDALGF